MERAQQFAEINHIIDLARDAEDVAERDESAVSVEGGARLDELNLLQADADALKLSEAGLSDNELQASIDALKERASVLFGKKL